MQSDHPDTCRVELTNEGMTRNETFHRVCTLESVKISKFNILVDKRP